MTISYNASGSNTGSTSASVGSLTVTAGQMITVVGVIADTATFTPTAGDVTYDAGSATIGTPTLDKYLVIDTGDAPYFLGLAFWSVLVTGSGSLAVRMTPTGSSAGCSMHLSIWDGSWDSSRVEDAPTIASSTTNNQTSHSSNSATSAGAALFLGGLAILQTGNKAITQDGSFTLLTEYEDGTTVLPGGASYRIVSSGTTDTSDYTSAAGTSWGWLSGLVVYKEAAGSAATLSSPTPSGTIGTSTTASIGASTNQNSGTGYAVVDSAANLSGVTASQIKAGQKASGSAALASGNVSVSSSPFSIGVSGLSAGTLYSYAIVQNNANGDSNVVTGTFTTAAGSSPVLSAATPSAQRNRRHTGRRF